MFLIWWKGYSTAEDTWEPEWNLGNAQPLLIAYKISHPKEFPEHNHHHPPAKQWISWLPPLFSSSSPFWFSLAGSAMCSGTLSTQTMDSIWASLGRDAPWLHLKYRTPPLTGRRCRSSLITASMITTLPQGGKDIRCSTWHLLPLSQCPLSCPYPPLKFLSTSSASPSHRGKLSSLISSPTPNSLLSLANLPFSGMTLSSPNLLASTNAMSSPAKVAVSERAWNKWGWVRTWVRRASCCMMGKQRKWKGISVVGIESTEGIVNERGDACWSALYPYKPEAVSLLSGLLSDCLCISFQSGVEFHISNLIRGCAYKESPRQTPVFELRVYQSM